MTTKDSFDAQPAAFEDTVFEHRLHHILAAGGRKAAGRRSQGRYENPIKVNGYEEEFPYNRPDIFFSDLHIAFSTVAKGCSCLSI